MVFCIYLQITLIYVMFTDIRILMLIITSSIMQIKIRYLQITLIYVMFTDIRILMLIITSSIMQIKIRGYIHHVVYCCIIRITDSLFFSCVAVRTTCYVCVCASFSYCKSHIRLCSLPGLPIRSTPSLTCKPRVKVVAHCVDDSLYNK